MSSSPVLVLDIDGVVSLAQPGSPAPWYATLQEDWGLSHDQELAPEFFLVTRIRNCRNCSGL